MLPIRILWKKDKKWMLNPYPNDINNLYELWAFCGILVSGNGKPYQRKEARSSPLSERE